MSSKVKKAKIGCFTYEIKFQETPESIHGETDTDSKKIWINSKFSKDTQKETLFHELLHVAMEDISFLDMPFDKDGEKEEALIRHISPRMVQILQDNKWISDFIFKAK